MNETPLELTIFLLGSVLFILFSIPTVIVYYIMGVIRRRRNPEWEEKALRKPLSNLERIITISAGVGLMIVSVGNLGWFYYNLFIARPSLLYSTSGVEFHNLFTIVAMVLGILALPLIFFTLGFWYFEAGLKKRRPDFRRRNRL